MLFGNYWAPANGSYVVGRMFKAKGVSNSSNQFHQTSCEPLVGAWYILPSELPLWALKVRVCGKGAILNNVYSERGRGEMQRLRGLSTTDLDKMQTRGRGPQSHKMCRRHLSMAPNTKPVFKSDNGQ